MFEGLGRIAGAFIQDQQIRIVAFGNYRGVKWIVRLKGFIIPRVISPDTIAKKQACKPDKYSFEVSLPDHRAKLANKAVDQIPDYFHTFRIMKWIPPEVSGQEQLMITGCGRHGETQNE